MSNQPPDVSPYQIRALIQNSTIGAVYRAYDPRHDREVALKGLWGDSPLSDEERRAFFRHEAEILRRIDHPRIPTLYEWAEGEHPYLAMELVDGPDLQTLLDRRTVPLPVRGVLQWGIQVCEILDTLHNLSPEPIAYRDLKPSHIVIDPQNDAWLVDFNLAIVLPPNRIETNASIEGTEGFAAPEQYRGKVTPATDIFGLGATLHYLLTQRNPSVEEPFSFHRTPPSSVNGDCPPSLDDIILGAVRKNSSQRIRSAQSLKKALTKELRRLPETLQNP